MALGIDDPEKWLETAEPRKVAFWEAFYRHEPFGGEWEQNAWVCSMLSSLIAVVGASAGAKIKPRGMEAFMPSAWLGHKKTTKVDTNSINVFKALAKKWQQQ